jgi:hypothetical protein
MEVEPSVDDVDALCEASLTNFNAGDVVGKLMALIAQLRACGEDTRDYLKKLGKMQGCPEWEIKLWIRTRWGSLSDCFRVVLTLQKVCIFFIPLSRLIRVFFDQALDQFCLFADTEDDLPPLASGKKWADYRLAASEWRIIRLAYDCLNVSCCLILFAL